MTELQQRIRAEALSYIGTPFRHAARIKGVGVDCGQLLIAVFSEAGVIADFDPGQYPPDWFLHRSRERYLEELLKRADPVEPPYEIGDILTYRYGRAVSHAGIYVGDGWLIHANGRAKTVTRSQMAMRGLSDHFAGAYRLRTDA